MITRCSVTGNVILLANGPIDWTVRKQSSVSGSTVHTEYAALSETSANVSHLRVLLSELEYPQVGPALLYDDNQGSLAIADLTGNHRRKFGYR